MTRKARNFHEQMELQLCLSKTEKFTLLFKILFYLKVSVAVFVTLGSCLINLTLYLDYNSSF